MNKTKAIVFFGIIIIGLIISIYSLNKYGKPVETPDGKPEPEKVVDVVPSKKANTPPTDPATAKPSQKKPTVAAKPNQKPAVTAGMPIDPKSKKSPQALMSALSKEIAEKDYDGFLKSVGEKSVPKSIRSRLKAIIESTGLDVDAKNPFSEISKSVEATRWAINLVPNTGSASTMQIYTDIKKIDSTSFDVINVAFPLEITASPAVNTTDPKMVKKDGTKPPSPDARKPDALTIAHAFAKAVVAKQFKAARALADSENVTDERVAALMIAVEEGKFSLKRERPLIVTLARDEITWVLTRLNSDDQTSEFALELGKVGDDWKINGLTFSKVIASLANSAGAGDVVYTPFVSNPEGGDSLVLYFEFDNAGVTPRTARQLAVIAKILKGDPSRKIVISGHADALGSDDYNAKLSDGRAASIRSTLVAEGAKPEQIITKAYGESKPRSPNFNPDGSDNPRGRSENRRAEVYLDF